MTAEGRGGQEFVRRDYREGGRAVGQNLKHYSSTILYISINFSDDGYCVLLFS